MERNLIAFGLMAFVLSGCSGGGKATATEDAKEKSKADAGVSSLTELKTEDTKVGKAPELTPKLKAAAVGDKVWMRYTGRFKDGTIFDSNDPSNDKGKGKPLFSFRLGEGGVIRGWDEGIVGMMPGGKRKLSVPWSMAYGETGRGEIPPRADLFFDVELVDIVKQGEENIFDVRDVKVGSGAVAAKGKTVSVHYIGRLSDGGLIQNSRTIGTREPISFKLGDNTTNSAIEEVIVGMRAGGTREAKLPPEIAPRPRSAALAGIQTPHYYTIELISVR